MLRNTEKRALQCVIALACIVPLSAGLCGMVAGASFFGGAGISLDSHVRYLSGLLFGIGIAFATAIPHIEHHAARFRLLTSIVVIGGLGRLLGLLLAGIPDHAMLLALVMELIVTPLLCFWQNSFAARALQ